jgi:hypothetical protein
VVGANLQSLVSSHNQSGLSVLLVLQKSDVSSSTLLPLVGVAVEFEKLRAHLEDLLLELLIGLDIDLLRETDNRLEVHILRFRCLILQEPIKSARLISSIIKGEGLVFIVIVYFSSPYLWVLLSGSCLLGLCGSGVIATVLILILLLLLRSTTKHGEDIISNVGGRSSGGCGRASRLLSHRLR